MNKSQFMKKYINDYYAKRYAKQAIDRFEQQRAADINNRSAQYRKRLNRGF